MGMYRKKPVVIEAFRWTGGVDQCEDPEWIIAAIKEDTGALPPKPCPVETGEAFDCDRDDGWCKDKLGRSFECKRHCLGEPCPEAVP